MRRNALQASVKDFSEKEPCFTRKTPRNGSKQSIQWDLYQGLSLIKTVGLTVTWPVFMSCPFFNTFFSIKSHYERYNQLCLKAIIQFNLPWRCRDILRLEMAELFYNKVTRRVIREQKKDHKTFEKHACGRPHVPLLVRCVHGRAR